ncbi:MAG TPA: hypothetical protein VK548_27355 [Candidatus Acidoferrum sp.]|nr:hypothetical protein [Candidatus Acidoferrum sp.]
MRTRVSIAMFFLLTTLVCGAEAQDLTLADDATFTPVSGYAGATKILGPTGGFRGLTAIEWWEDSDEPCKIRLDSVNVNTGDVNQPELVLNGIQPRLGSQPCSSPGNRKRVAFAGAANWIHKVQVCTTDKKDSSEDKLKGIRIWPATVNDRSPLSISYGSTAQEDKHTHCEKWRSEVACPQGKIGARLRVHHDGAETKVIGLALECRTLRLQ